MGQYEGGRGLKWPKIGDVVYGWPLRPNTSDTVFQFGLGSNSKVAQIYVKKSKSNGIVS